MRTEIIYNNSPVILQNIMTSMYGMLLHWQRYGGNCSKFAKELELTEHKNENQLRDLQNQKLKNIIRIAYNRTIYYRELFDKIGITPEEINDIDDLKKIPILAKSDLRKNQKLLIASPPGLKKCLKIYTSGTTGSPITVYYDLESRRRNYAFFNRIRRWQNISIGNRRSTFYGRAIIPPKSKRKSFWRYDFSENNYLFSSYHMTPDNLPLYYEKLKKIQPIEIRGYPSSLNNIGQYIIDNNLRKIKPKAIFTTAETLNEKFRDTIETAFDCSVTDTYGCTEMAFYITQCEFGTYHAHPEYGIVETIDNNDKNVIGRPGELVCTSFINNAMPLIRYKVGDIVTITPGNCECGRNFQVIGEILGRVDDYILTPDGRKIGRLDPIFKGGLKIKETQIIQTKPNEIMLKIVPSAGFSENDKKFLREQLVTRIGTSMKIMFKIVKEIPRDKNGKFRAVISHIK